MWRGGRRFFLSLTILTASVCLALGITMPILKLTTFTFWTTEHSLISTVGVLLHDKQTFLGLIVLVFQEGHGSDLLFGIEATGSIPSWMPLMLFAFLFGLSMDYEVFILSRMREEYDRTGST